MSAPAMSFEVVRLVEALRATPPDRRLEVLSWAKRQALARADVDVVSRIDLALRVERGETAIQPALGHLLAAEARRHRDTEIGRLYRELRQLDSLPADPTRAERSREALDQLRRLQHAEATELAAILVERRREDRQRLDDARGAAHRLLKEHAAPSTDDTPSDDDD